MLHICRCQTMYDLNPYNLTNTNSVWSSDYIVKARASYNNSLYQWQKTNGCNLFLSFHNGNTMKLSVATGSSTIIAFPEGPRTRIRTIYKQITGAPNTYYYVYLTATDFFISTTPPSHRFFKLWVNATFNAIVVGWCAFADWNWMDGEWNLYSFWNEPQRTYSTPVVYPTTTITKRGFITPEGKRSLLSRDGKSCASASCGAYSCADVGTNNISYRTGACYYVYDCGGSVVCGGIAPFIFCTYVPFYCTIAYSTHVSITVSLEPSGYFTSPIRDIFTLRHSHSGWISLVSGNLILERIGG